MLEALKEINLRDLTVILEALDEFAEKVQNEEKALVKITAKKIEKAYEQQQEYLYEEFSKEGK